MVKASSYYTATYEGLRAAEMRTIVTAAVHEGDTRLSVTYTYSIETYAARATREDVKKICTAMIAYGDSAAAYFAN